MVVRCKYGDSLLVASLSEKGLTLTISTASLSHVT